MPSPTSETLEIRPAEDEDTAADFLTGSGGARHRDNSRIERRNAHPCPGWYAIRLTGATGPFPTADAAVRGMRR